MSAWVANLSSQDLLQLLLEAELDGTSEKFSDKQIVGFAIDFLMSGHETTASVLSCVSYQLALHNEVQDQVQEEIDGYFKKRPVSVHVHRTLTAGLV